ncbi:hypothetical protein CO657_05930 [Rhizobium acidisoli]|uniref:Uncharacterized protein n=1 Tax=Rhizobium acidisoli TaxID=1538158 RepID=A0AAE5WMS5_9HYPH|nr:hypothetical protein [Rhizobium acidisoli]KPH10636.1 hypothetical protein AOG23_03815 [Rhizobium acidisoli]QAS77646.1 hypothetical protein CO657_05930 [Rhizobium acidisoli]
MDDKESLIIEYGKLKASAVGRFPVIAVLFCIFTFVAGVSYFGGTKVVDWLHGPQATASIEK